MEQNLQLKHYCETLSKMINCKTVYTEEGTYQKEFDKFYQVLEDAFPLLHQKATRIRFGSGCFIYHIEGKNANRRIMLMSHHDVVDASNDWQTPPFTATIQEDRLYGRGSIDTKTPLFAQLQAVEELLKEGYDFAGINLYIGSSNNEEVGGDGMILVREYCIKHNIHFDIIMDEGGAIICNMIPGYEGKSAMIAVHEKSRHVFKCSTNKMAKGHNGLTNKGDHPLQRLVNFIDEVLNTRIYENHFYPEVKATFQYHVPYMSFPMNFIFKHIDKFQKPIKNMMNNIPTAKAMLSTSINFTSIHAGDANHPQVEANNASCTMFIRCIREEDLWQGIEQIKQIAERYDVEIQCIEEDYCKPTAFDTTYFQQIKDLVENQFPNVVAAPFLLTAGTDARHFSDVADHIFRFAPIDLDPKQFVSIHGDNENIKIQNILQCVLFYKQFIKTI